jgi:membrane protease YdiL (CAAX protease family)
VIPAIMAGGVLAVVVAWRLVATGRSSVWATMSVVMAGAAAAALATGRVSLSPEVRPVWAGLAGAGAGLALYAATAVFVMVVRRWPTFARHVESVYDQRKGMPLVAGLALAAGIVSPSEEIFWRGLFQGRLAETVSGPVAAVLAWAAYVGANVASGSLPIVAAAMVSGAVWGGLALWTGGILASLACHSLWTGLMVARPLGGTRERRSRNTAEARAHP